MTLIAWIKSLGFVGGLSENYYYIHLNFKGCTRFLSICYCWSSLTLIIIVVAASIYNNWRRDFGKFRFDLLLRASQKEITRTLRHFVDKIKTASYLTTNNSAVPVLKAFNPVHYFISIKQRAVKTITHFL